jgi:hypothetical protein
VDPVKTDVKMAVITKVAVVSSDATTKAKKVSFMMILG